METSIKLWISLKKVHKIIKSNQKAWLKPYTDMKTDLKIKQKKILKTMFLN